MAIDPATLLAYRQTEYHLIGPTPAVLRVDVRCPPLALLHAVHDVRCSAFITACNPQGVKCADDVNRQRQAALATHLSNLKLAMIDGIGRHPTNGWPPEPSFLVPGLSRPAAEEVGRLFEQNAILWAGPEAIPQLVLLR